MPPNHKCIVCSSKPEVTIKIDTTKVTIKQFRNDVLIKALNMIQPDVTVDSKGIILISSEDGETDCNDDKTLAEMDVVDGVILKADDFFQNYELSVIILHKEPEREDAPFEIIADPDMLKATNEVVAAPAAEKTTDGDEKNGVSPAKKAPVENTDNDDDDVTIVEAEPSTSNGKTQGSADTDDDCCIVDDDVYIIEDDGIVGSTSGTASETKKRKTNDFLGEPSSKRTKTVAPPDDNDDLVLIEDD